MDKTKLKANYVKYCESLKSRGLNYIANDIDASEYLTYSLNDLRDAIRDEQNEHIRNVLLIVMYMKVEETNPALVPELALTHTKT